MKWLLLLFFLLACTQTVDVQQNDTIETENSTYALRTLPKVAVHVSEPSEVNWDNQLGLNYVEGHRSVETILTSHKIPYDILTDEDIINGALLQNTTPLYPMLISINNPYTQTSSAVDDYVKKGGTLFFNANSFTQGGCFTLSFNATCQNTWHFTKSATLSEHSFLSHLPKGERVWRSSQQAFMVESEEEVARNSWDNVTGTMMAVQDKGKGQFVYHSHLRPFWGRAEGHPDVMNTFFLIHAIENAYERTNTPFVFIRPWNEYQAAFMMRFDVEPSREILFEYFPQFVDLSAKHNVSSTFYILVDQVQANDVYQGGFYRAKNPKEMALWKNATAQEMVVGAHSTWHLGPDVDRLGAEYNIEHSLDILTEVTGERPNEWVSPNFLAQKHSSLELIESLNITTTGDQKISYLPHFAVSPETGETFSFLQLPSSEAYFEKPGAVDYYLTALDHHNPASVEELVETYYTHQGLINLYAHIKPRNTYVFDTLLNELETYDDVWYATPDELYEHWKIRAQTDIKNIRQVNDTLVIDVVAPTPVVLQVGKDTQTVEETTTITIK